MRGLPIENIDLPGENEQMEEIENNLSDEDICAWCGEPIGEDEQWTIDENGNKIHFACE
jgi:hypothetical protein